MSTTGQQTQAPLAVQATNDDSIVSKRSASARGYMKDEFLRAFVAKSQRRAPLINRGYYIRCYALRSLVRTFLVPGERRQVISLGAGFDTTYWVLKEEKGLSDGHVYYELDFAELVKRKTSLIKSEFLTSRTLAQTPEEIEAEAEHLARLDREIGEASEQASAASAANDESKLREAKNQIVQLEKERRKLTDEIHRPDYHLAACDLRHLSNLTEILTGLGVDWSVPTVVFAECVLMYLPEPQSSALISWAADRFSDLAFISYDQLIPYDCFGRVMRTTLDKRASPLLGIEANPTVDHHIARYLRLGYSQASGLDLLAIAARDWPAQRNSDGKTEQCRVDVIEEFDEMEEWMVKCTHYGISIGSKTSTPDIFGPLHQRLSSPAGAFKPLSEPSLDVGRAVVSKVSGRFEGRTASTKRWGHASDVCGDNVIVFGGFGGEAKQQRLNDVIALNSQTLAWSLMVIGGIVPEARQFHSLTNIGEARLFLFGGRTAPSKPLGDSYILDLTSRAWKSVTHTPAPAARYRHTSTLLRTTSGSFVCTFGGRTTTATKNLFTALNTTTLFRLPSVEHLAASALSPRSSSPPPARHSHTATAIRSATQAIVFGGIDESQRFFNDTYRLELETSDDSSVPLVRWTRLDCTGQVPSPRFAHSAVYLSAPIDSLLVVGGCSPGAQNDAYLLNLTSLDWRRIELLGVDPSQLVLIKNTLTLVRDKYLVSVGGGLTCFSFGTHVNDAFMAEFHPNASTLPKTELSIADLKIAPTATAEPTQPTSTRAYSAAVPPKERGAVELVPEVIGVTKEIWESKIYASRRPVLMKAVNLGPCLAQWTKPEYFFQHHASKKVSVRVSTEKRLDFVNKNYKFQTMELKDFITKVFDLSLQDKFYFRSVGENLRRDVSDIQTSFPELAADFQLPELFKTIISPEKTFSSALRISSNDIQMWTHYDVMDNILCQVVGSKKVVMWPPEEFKNLYVQDSSSEVLDIDNPDLINFPKFAKAQPIEAILNPGDVLFIPAMWFHNVVTLSPAISVNIFYRHLEPSQYHPKDLYGNKDLVPAENALVQLDKALASLAQLPEYYRAFYGQMMIEKIKNHLK